MRPLTFPVTWELFNGIGPIAVQATVLSWIVGSNGAFNGGKGGVSSRGPSSVGHSSGRKSCAGLSLWLPGFWLGLWAVALENAPTPSNARNTPARAMNRPMKTRRFKKADWESDFFFIRGAWVRDRMIR